MNNGITGGQGFVTELFVTERPLTQDEAEALESAGTPKRPDPASQPCGNDAYSRLKPGQTCRDCYGRLFVRLDYDKCRSDWALVTDVPDKVGFDSQDLSPPRPPIVSGFLAYFPDAIAAVARVSHKGNEKHNPGEPLHWSRGKSSDHGDCAVRHMMTPDAIDPDSGEMERAHAAWRILADLQLAEEKRLIAAGIKPLSGVTT